MSGKSGFRLLACTVALVVARWSPGQAILASQPTQVGKITESPSQSAGIRRAPAPVVPDPIRRPQAIGFHRMVHSAGIIFSGTVINIEPRPASGGQSLETVAITFRVDDAIRGATPGETLTISQWTGLWSAGQRYRIGERVVLFLYPASRLGLTSSVSGLMGRFEMDAAHRIVISEQHRLAFRDDPVLAGKSRVTFREFARAVRETSGSAITSRGIHEN
jgi:hypothetical protein